MAGDIQQTCPPVQAGNLETCVNKRVEEVLLCASVAVVAVLRVLCRGRALLAHRRAVGLPPRLDLAYAAKVTVAAVRPVGAALRPPEPRAGPAGALFVARGTSRPARLAEFKGLGLGLFSGHLAEGLQRGQDAQHLLPAAAGIILGGRPGLDPPDQPGAELLIVLVVVRIRHLDERVLHPDHGRQGLAAALLAQPGGQGRLLRRVVLDLGPAVLLFDGARP
mmetsp:Transcript_34014/g.90177  ORF Transcript_34014/g.90177 Transcript_34014/m.90177 type:complete len:221 (+) Transcript_34014:450-1112(+)